MQAYVFCSYALIDSIMAKDEGCSFELQTYSNVVEIPTRKGHRKSIFFVSRIREKEMVICYPNKGPFAARFQLLNQRWSSLASLVSPWNQNPTTRRQKRKRKPTKRIEIGTRNNFSQPYLSFIIPSCRWPLLFSSSSTSTYYRGLTFVAHRTCEVMIVGFEGVKRYIQDTNEKIHSESEIHLGSLFAHLIMISNFINPNNPQYQIPSSQL